MASVETGSEVMPDSTGRTLAWKARQSSQEQCGFILDNWHVVDIKNRAKNSTREFLFDPDEQMSVVRDCTEQGMSILGVWHTHPGGSILPSKDDMAGWPILMDGSYCRYWIATGLIVREYKVQDGRPVMVHEIRGIHR